MHRSALSAIGPILAAPWQQQRNRQGWWISVAIFVLSLLVSGGSLVSGLFVQARDAQVAAALHHIAVVFSRWMVVMMPVVWWPALVSNVLEQNHPTFAQVVPRHPRQLRTALLVASAALVAFVACVAFHGLYDPLASAAIAAAALAVAAAASRWPWIWFCGVPLPYALSGYWLPLAGVVRALRLQWHLQPVAFALTVFAASAVVLVALIQE